MRHVTYDEIRRLARAAFGFGTHDWAQVHDFAVSLLVAAHSGEKNDQIASMTWHCQNIDQDSQGWYATIYVPERGEHVCGRGVGIWAAVQDAHRLAANASNEGPELATVPLD